MNNIISGLFCRSVTQSNQEHLLTCEGMSFERRGLDLQKEQDFVQFWLRVTANLSKLQDKRLSLGSTCDAPNILVISIGVSSDFHK